MEENTVISYLFSQKMLLTFPLSLCFSRAYVNTEGLLLSRNVLFSLKTSVTHKKIFSQLLFLMTCKLQLFSSGKFCRHLNRPTIMSKHDKPKHAQCINHHEMCTLQYATIVYALRWGCTLMNELAVRLPCLQ